MEFQNYVAKLICVYLINWFILNHFQCLVNCLLDAFNSNHYRGPESEVIRFLEMHGVPYHYLGATAESKREEEILELVQNTDFLVLARYIRVNNLITGCCNWFQTLEIRNLFLRAFIIYSIWLCYCLIALMVSIKYEHELLFFPFFLLIYYCRYYPAPF